MKPGRRGRGARRGVIVAVAVALGGLTACTGIPASSSPQVIQSVQVGQSAPIVTITPTPGADQREIVREFLEAEVTHDEHNAGAREFLTPAASNSWGDSTVTVVNSGTWEIGNFDSANSTVTARGQVLGTVGSTGIYTPVLRGDGNGEPATFVFGLTRNPARQWRISNPPTGTGLIIQSSDFQRYYVQRNLYFYDSAGGQLIPDPRYTSLANPDQLANWLVQQLITGSRPELQAVTAGGATQQIDPRRIVVTANSSTTSVGIPGSSQLAAASRNVLGGQIAATLDQIQGLPHRMMITDAGRPVIVPAAHGAAFTAANFDAITATGTVSAPPLFYLRGGAVIVGESGRPVAGVLGSGVYRLTSVALAHTAQSGQSDLDDLEVAATAGPKDHARLFVGSTNQGLQATSVHGELTRPSWAPDASEVWVSDGTRVWNVSTTGTAKAVSLTPTTGELPGRIIALRVSPDGTRVAMVIGGVGGSGQIWMGSIAHNAGATVSVVSLEPISPLAVDITDVAWYGPVKLFAIGRTDGGLSSTYDVQVDGSLWTQSTTSGLPQAPDTVTIAENAFAWVSAGLTVWEQSASQSAGQWTSPIGTNTVGTAPVYLE